MELIGQANEIRHTLSPKLNLYFLQESFEKFLYFLYFYIVYIFYIYFLQRKFLTPSSEAALTFSCPVTNTFISGL